MKITKQDLIDRDASSYLTDWFADEFGEETELGELKKRLGWAHNGLPPFDWQHWLFEKFKLSGTFECRHKNGQLWVRGRYKDGKRHRHYESWDEDGEPRKRCQYKHGRKLGPDKVKITKQQLIDEGISAAELAWFESVHPSWDEETREEHMEAILEFLIKRQMKLLRSPRKPL